MRRAELAPEAALGEVTLAGALRCDTALPAVDFDLVPDELERNVEDAARPASVLVTLALTILASWLNVNFYTVVPRACEYNIVDRVVMRRWAVKVPTQAVSRSSKREKGRPLKAWSLLLLL